MILSFSFIFQAFQWYEKKWNAKKWEMIREEVNNWPQTSFQAGTVR